MNENWYDRHILPYLIDFACGMAPIRAQRARVVPLAGGRVLEIGIGTGLNIAHYDRTRVNEVVGVDPALRMHRLARRRIAQAGLPVQLVGLSAEKLPLENASFDSAVMTYTLCSIPDPLAALREIRRVLKPDARLYFCEHGRAPDDSVRRWQQRLQPWWTPIAGGCQLGRDIPALLAEAGFAARTLEQAYLQGPRPLSYHYWGTAMAA